MTRLDSPELFVFSGAGLSAESGISTFRDRDGTWAKFDINRVCNYDTWLDHREEVFAFYGQRLAEMRGVQPNDAHRRLATWQARWGAHRVHLLTQNVDTLLESAGASDVTHLHGNLHDLLCVPCNHVFRVALSAYGAHTKCPRCHSEARVKPGVTFFNEHSDAYQAIHDMKERLRPQDIVLVVGTSLTVISAEQLLPRRRFGHEHNWQVNPHPDRSEWFSLNLPACATAGLRELEPRLMKLMDADASSHEAPQPRAIHAWRCLREWFARRKGHRLT